MKWITLAFFMSCIVVFTTSCNKNDGYDGIKKDDRIENFAEVIAGNYQGVLDLYEGAGNKGKTPIVFDIVKLDDSSCELKISGDGDGKVIVIQLAQQFEENGIYFISINIEEQTIESEKIIGQEKGLHGKLIHGALNTSNNYIELYFNSDSQNGLLKLKLTGTKAV